MTEKCCLFRKNCDRVFVKTFWRLFNSLWRNTNIFYEIVALLSRNLCQFTSNKYSVWHLVSQICVKFSDSLFSGTNWWIWPNSISNESLGCLHSMLFKVFIFFKSHRGWNNSSQIKPLLNKFFFSKIGWLHVKHCTFQFYVVMILREISCIFSCVKCASF